MSDRPQEVQALEPILRRHGPEAGARDRHRHEIARRPIIFEDEHGAQD